MFNKTNYLEPFNHYCIDEKALDDEIALNRPRINFKKKMNDLNKNNSVNTVSNVNNLMKTRELVDSFSITHYTSLKNLLGIICEGFLLSRKSLEDKDMLPIWGTYRTGHESLEDCVSCGTESGNWIYGMYEIRLKREADYIPNARFLPLSSACYDACEIDENIMELLNWRTYLSEYIARNFINVEDYLKSMSYYKRPEFLFEKQIPVSLIEEIRCASEKTCMVLKEELTSASLDQKAIIELIKTQKS